MIINKATFDGNDFVYQPGIGISIDNQNVVSSDIADMLMIQHTLSNGYYDTSGHIQSASAVDGQRYTNKIAVLEGEQIRVKYDSDHLPTGAKMWFAYATFNASGTFIKRIEVLTPTIKKGFDETITIGSGVGFISLMFSSFASSGAYSFTPLAMFNSVIQLVADLKREEATLKADVNTLKANEVVTQIDASKITRGSSSISIFKVGGYMTPTRVHCEVALKAESAISSALSFPFFKILGAPTPRQPVVGAFFLPQYGYPAQATYDSATGYFKQAVTSSIAAGTLVSFIIDYAI